MYNKKKKEKGGKGGRGGGKNKMEEGSICLQGPASLNPTPGPGLNRLSLSAWLGLMAGG